MIDDRINFGVDYRTKKNIVSSLRCLGGNSWIFRHISIWL